jgi:hypothetical protein
MTSFLNSLLNNGTVETLMSIGCRMWKHRIYCRFQEWLVSGNINIHILYNSY